MKKISTFIILLTIVLNAQDVSYWDKATSKFSSIVDKTKELGTKGWNKTKEYSHKSKNIAIETTVLNGINTLTNNDMIKVETFKINNQTDEINMELFLNGENKKLLVNIKDFQWSVTTDDKYIVFDKLTIDLNISWLNYLLKDKIKRDGGKLIIPNTALVFSLLYSIKPNNKCTIQSVQKKSFDFLHYAYDTEYFNIKTFNIQDNKLQISIALKNSNDINCLISNYTLATANHKELIVLQNIEFISCSKPWIQSIIKKQDDEVVMDFNQKLYQILQK